MEQGNYKLGMIGGGNMARAIFDCATGSRFLSAKDILISEPDPARRSYFEEKGARTCGDNRFVAEHCDFLLFAVKPQTFPLVAEQLRGAHFGCVISIMAGVSKASVRARLGDIRVARVMPNLGYAAFEGAAGVDASGCTEEEKAFVFGLFSSGGKAVETEESLMNAVTGVSGSGPAYVFAFLEALTAAGVAEGLGESEARELAEQTLRGSVALLKTGERTAREWIDAVSSKGGTTVAALESMERDGFSETVARGVQAAARRAEELSR